MILNFSVGDYLDLRKAHPCGCSRFEVLYVGSDIKIRCIQCRREMLLPRVKLEKSIKKVLSEQEND